MKAGWFVTGAGLAGALAGILTFMLTRGLVEDLLIRLAAGGLVAVMAPLIIVFMVYPKLVAGKKPEGKKPE